MKIGAAGLFACAILGLSAANATAQTVDARSFAPTPHKGTAADPWPGGAIVKAINSLPAAGGTVVVNDGVWLFDTEQFVGRGNFTLQGSSLAARLVFTTGDLVIGRPNDSDITPIANVKISTITADQSRADPNSGTQGIQVWSCTGCELSDSFMIGHANVSVAVFITQGGQDGKILRNKFTGVGGSQLQINPLFNTTNAGFLVDSNELDSVNLLTIGMSNLTVTNNNVHNKTLGNFIAMFFAAACQASSHDVLVQNNTVDASVGGSNGAVISGIPQDPGCGGSITNFTIDSNTLRGDTIIGSSVYDDQSCLAGCDTITQTTNFVVTNNTLDAQTNLGHFANINVEGGASGSVRGVTITGNTVPHDGANVIQVDNHTTGLHIGDNAGCTSRQITRGRCRWLHVQRFTN